MKPKKPEIKLHEAQTAILHVLLFQPDASFSQVNVTGLGSDHFSFHLQRLLEAELVAKNEEGRYLLTVAGKEFANRYDTDNRKVEKQAKVALLLLVSKAEGGIERRLVQRRLKQPYYGFYGHPGGKIKWGEEVLEAAARELLEETGLTATLAVEGVEHKIDVDPDGVLLEDKFFFIVRGTDPRGELLEKIEGGENLWVTHEEMEALTPTYGKMTDLENRVRHAAYWREWRYVADTY